MTAKFFSDCNFDGFVQLIALQRIEHEADPDTREVSIEEPTEVAYDLVNDWGGEILQ